MADETIEERVVLEVIRRATRAACLRSAERILRDQGPNADGAVIALTLAPTDPREVVAGLKAAGYAVVFIDGSDAEEPTT